MTCESDDVLDDDILSECSEERSEGSVEFVGCGFNEEKKQNK
jgi:hypothetical protein